MMKSKQYLLNHYPPLSTVLKLTVGSGFWLVVACATPTPSSSSDNGGGPDLSLANACPSQSTLKTHTGQVKTDTIPNPFGGFPNPNIRLQNGQLSISVSTKNSGFLELSKFPANQLQVGEFQGTQFELSLLYASPYENCSNIPHRSQAKLKIETYTPNEKIGGCLYSQFTCETNQQLEIAIPFSGEIK